MVLKCLPPILSLAQSITMSVLLRSFGRTVTRRSVVSTPSWRASSLAQASPSCASVSRVIPTVSSASCPLMSSKRYLLLGIPRALSPQLLEILASMGHGDEILLADANFPAASVADAMFGPSSRAHRLVTLPHIGGVELLNAILKVLPVDTYVTYPAAVMQRVPGDVAKGVQVPIWAEYKKALNAATKSTVAVEEIERMAFYQRAKTCYAIVATGEAALYANLIIKKGVITA